MLHWLIKPPKRINTTGILILQVAIITSYFLFFLYFQHFIRRSIFFTFTIVVPLAPENTVFFFDMSPTQYNILPSLSISLANPESNKKHLKSKSVTFYNSVRQYGYPSSERFVVLNSGLYRT